MGLKAKDFYYKPGDAQFNRAFGMLRKKGTSERSIHKQLCEYVRIQYPKIRFYSSLDGEDMPAHQREAARLLMHSTGFPDFLLFYKGSLAIEIKRHRTDLYMSSGKLKKTAHIKEQIGWLKYLKDNGWNATFACGFEECKSIIDTYIASRNL